MSGAASTDRRPPGLITCGGCPSTWTAAGATHCAGCHESFSGLSLFDRHRNAAGPRGRCVPPAELRDPSGEPLCKFRDGMWRGPEMTDQQKAARFGAT